MELFVVLGLLAIPLLYFYDKYLAPRILSWVRSFGHRMMAASWSRYPVEKLRVRRVVLASQAPLLEYGPSGEAYVRGYEPCLRLRVVDSATGAEVGEFDVFPPHRLVEEVVAGRILVGQVASDTQGSQLRVDWDATEEAWAAEGTYRSARIGGGR